MIAEQIYKALDFQRVLRLKLRNKIELLSKVHPSHFVKREV